MQTITAATARPINPAAVMMRGTVTTPRRGAEDGVRRTFSKGEELYAEGDAAEFFCKVVSGTVRICKVLNDGRRQIETFHLAGDIFGLECGSKHRFAAEAVD